MLCFDMVFVVFSIFMNHFNFCPNPECYLYQKKVKKSCNSHILCASAILNSLFDLAYVFLTNRVFSKIFSLWRFSNSILDQCCGLDYDVRFHFDYHSNFCLKRQNYIGFGIEPLINFSQFFILPAYLPRDAVVQIDVSSFNDKFSLNNYSLESCIRGQNFDFVCFNVNIIYQHQIFSDILLNELNMVITDYPLYEIIYVFFGDVDYCNYPSFEVARLFLSIYMSCYLNSFHFRFNRSYHLCMRFSLFFKVEGQLCYSGAYGTKLRPVTNIPLYMRRYFEELYDYPFYHSPIDFEDPYFIQ